MNGLKAASILLAIFCCAATSANATGTVTTTSDDGFVVETFAGFPDSLPVEGVYRRQLEQRQDRDIVGVLHAVRRVPGATIVYASQGFSEYRNEQNFGAVDWDDILGEEDSFQFAALVDSNSRQYWFPYRTEQQPDCLCPEKTMSPFFRHNVNDTEDGDGADGLWTFAIAYPPLPEEVTSVDVSITGDGKFLTGIPVGVGALQPMSEPSESVKNQSFRYFQKVGESGWPYIPDKGFFNNTVTNQTLDATSTDSEIPLQGDVSEHVSSRTQGFDKKAEGHHSEYVLSADIAFEFDSSNLSGEAVTVLQQAVQDSGNHATRVTVHGYTDDQGDAAYNDELSSLRAEAVADVLRSGLTDAAFEVHGFGESNPVASNGTEEGRAKNRRVVVTIEK